MKVSFFKNLYEKQVSFTLDTIEVLERIRTGKSKAIIDQVRAGDSESKKKLPAICFNGTFTSRNDNSLIEHSGLCILDFDKYPTKKAMKDERKRLEDDPYVFSVFTSPSGNGLKVLVRIPKCDKDEHKLYFKSLEKHFSSEYFDEKNCNVSRVCFESYDPKIYINDLAEEWTEKATEEGYHVTTRTPILPLRNESEIIDRLMKWWNENYGFTEGNRNNNLYILACSFCNYGIDQDLATNYIIRNVIDGDFTQSETEIAVRSAYKTSEWNTKYFEDKQTLKRIELKVRKGESVDSISKSLNIDKTDIEDVSEEIKRNNIEFWVINKNRNGVETVTIDPMKYKLFLEEHGFAKYYPEDSDQPIFVRHKENIVNTTSTEKIKDFVLTYLEEKEIHNVWNYCAKTTKIFTDDHLNMLESISLKMLQDEEDTCYLYFQNGVVCIHKDSVEFKSYVDVNGFVWEQQIISREYTKSKKIENDFQDFVQKVSAGEDIRIEALENTLGYLVHSYKDKTEQKAIILNDQEINDDPNGGSGKSLMLEAVGKFKRLVKIDGKIFDPNRSEFVYQRVNIDTQVLAFDDVRKNFNFENLFSIITEGISVRQLFKGEFFIPFDRSPKIVITTNYVIDGAGGSHDRRRHEIEFFQYFNAKRTPLDVYGRLLFDGWDESDWIAFDNYMIHITQKYLNNGLTQPVSINADVKRFIQQTSKDFYDWIEDGNLKHNCRVYIKEIAELFKDEYKNYQNLNNRTFVKWVIRYCDLNGYNFNRDRDHSGRFFEIFTNDVDLEEVDEMPF